MDLITTLGMPGRSSAGPGERQMQSSQTAAAVMVFAKAAHKQLGGDPLLHSKYHSVIGLDPDGRRAKLQFSGRHDTWWSSIRVTTAGDTIPLSLQLHTPLGTAGLRG